jgi:hypothetical protein
MRALWTAAAVLGVAAAPCAQARLPLPDAAARAAAHGELLDVIAAIQVQPGAATAVDRVLAAAADPARNAALRCELFEHALRCARAAGDVLAGLRAADAFEAAFAVDGADEQLLERFASEGRAPAQAIAGACLDAAWKLLDADAPAFVVRLAQARRLAAADAPRGLRAAVEAAATDLETMHTVAARVRAAPDDQKLALRYRTHYRGDWPERVEDVGDGTDRVARGLRSKIEARTAPRDVAALARVGELWWSLCAQEQDPIAQRNLSRRAMLLLQPMAMFDPADADPRPETAEVERVRRLLTQATARARAPGPGSLRFADAADLGRMFITGGEWRVEGGRLLGKSLGPDVATRATAAFAWRRIDCITLRAGIQSDDGLNLRLAVGTLNILFNWEVADANHFYFGEGFLTTSPRVLQAKREHVIELRQLDEQVAVCVDGKRVALGQARLAGTVTVYPALGSEIFVSAIDVVGDPDLGRVVTGPDRAR